MTSDDKALIAAAIDRFIRAYKSADLAGVLAVFAPDYVDMGEGERTLRGKRSSTTPPPACVTHLKSSIRTSK